MCVFDRHAHTSSSSSNAKENPILPLGTRSWPLNELFQKILYPSHGTIWFVPSLKSHPSRNHSLVSQIPLKHIYLISLLNPPIP